MRFAIGVPNVGPFGDPGLLVELAVQTEQAGWDGWFVWDHLLYHDPAWPVADPLVTLSAVAASTERIQLGVLMLALPRRRPWKVAKELASIDRLSEGRLVAGFGLGSMAREYSAFAEDSELPTRAEKLEEGLEVIARSWTGEEVSFDGAHYKMEGVRLLPTPVREPRPPVWLAGTWPHKAPFIRAARWDGVMPIHPDFGKGETIPAQVLAEVRELVASHRPSMDGFDLAVEGATDARGHEAKTIAAYRRAGVTWWVEALGWWRGDTKRAGQRIALGPPV